MKKQILNLGKVLNKKEQRNVFGGDLTGPGPSCFDHSDCPYGMGCCNDRSSQPFKIGVCLGFKVYNAHCPYNI